MRFEKPWNMVSFVYTFGFMFDQQIRAAIFGYSINGSIVIGTILCAVRLVASA